MSDHRFSTVHRPSATEQGPGMTSEPTNQARRLPSMSKRTTPFILATSCSPCTSTVTAQDTHVTARFSRPLSSSGAPFRVWLLPVLWHEELCCDWLAASQSKHHRLHTCVLSAFSISWKMMVALGAPLPPAPDGPLATGGAAAFLLPACGRRRDQSRAEQHMGQLAAHDTPQTNIRSIISRWRPTNVRVEAQRAGSVRLIRGGHHHTVRNTTTCLRGCRSSLYVSMTAYPDPWSSRIACVLP
jgi:hypothetical protein